MTRVMTRNYTRNETILSPFVHFCAMKVEASVLLGPGSKTQQFLPNERQRLSVSPQSRADLHTHTHTYTHKYRRISFCFHRPTFFAQLSFYRQIIKTENKGKFITSLESEINMSVRELLSGWWLRMGHWIFWHITVTQVTRVTQTHIGEYRFNKRRVKIYI